MSDRTRNAVADAITRRLEYSLAKAVTPARPWSWELGEAETRGVVGDAAGQIIDSIDRAVDSLFADLRDGR